MGAQGRGGGGPGGQDGQRQASERGSVELHGIGLSQGLHWRRETRVRKALQRGPPSPERSLALQKPVETRPPPQP